MRVITEDLKKLMLSFGLNEEDISNLQNNVPIIAAANPNFYNYEEEYK